MKSIIIKILLIIILMASYKALISITQWRSRRFNILYFPARYCVAKFLKYEFFFLSKAPSNGLQGAVAQSAAN